MRVKKGSNRLLKDASNLGCQSQWSRQSQQVRKVLTLLLAEAGTLSSAKVHSVHATSPHISSRLCWKLGLVLEVGLDDALG